MTASVLRGSGRQNAGHHRRLYGPRVLCDGARVFRGVDARYRQSTRNGTECPGDGLRTPGVLVRRDGSDTTVLATGAGPTHYYPRGVDAGDLRSALLFAD